MQSADLDACLEALRFLGRAAAGPRSVVAEAEGAAPAESTLGQLGDFRLVREVGRGGMGVVYEAEQVSLGRRVALKVLPLAATLDPRQLQRFHNEARAAAVLDHPNIVHVHAVGCERGVHYYAMQFIEGQTLAALIADLRQPGRPALAEPTTAHVHEAPAAPAADTAPQAAASTERAPRDQIYFRRAAELAVQAAEALEHAHGLGIVHRDVKPANLLLDGHGGLWVTDFGLAHIQSDARLTLTGDLVGTLRYMSPEQALARRVVVDHRTDVYSLGATLYELLTLEPVFGGSDRQELLRQIAFEDPERPRRINKAVPAELETIVLKALEKNPADRYATAQELADDLRRFLADEPILARPAGVVLRLRKWGRRHRATVTAGVTVLLAALLLGGVALWRELGLRAAAEHAGESALERAELLQQQERWDEALAVLALAQGQLEGRGLGALRQRVEQVQRDVEMQKKLEEAVLQGAAESKGAGIDYPGVDRVYTAAFANYGLDITLLDPQVAANGIRASAIRPRLIAALDFWGQARDHLHPEGGKPQRAVANLADDDPWQRRLREALGHLDLASLEKLAGEDALRKASTSLVMLALALPQPAKGALGERLLRQAQKARPADFLINFSLGGLLNDSGKQDEALRFHQAALALRPNSPVVYCNLGIAYWRKWDLVEAEAAFREALHLHKDYAEAHAVLGAVLLNMGNVDGSIAELREAIRLKGDDATAHYNLAISLRHKGRRDEAIAELREAIRLKEDYADAHDNLGGMLQARGDLDGAMAEHHAALRINLDHFGAHYNLGNALKRKGKLDEAIGEYCMALQIKNDFAKAHCNLGLAFRDQGYFAEALRHLRRGHALGSKDPGWSHPSAEWVRGCEELVEIEGKLPDVLSGKEPAGDALHRVRYAEMCYRKRLYAASARLYREAVTAQPELTSPRRGIRYNAACSAALAGCGAGEEVVKLTEAERAELRKEALDWLWADLDAWRGLLIKEPTKSRSEVAREMRHWLSDSDFNGVRGQDALGQLPEAERGKWQRLWKQVEALRRLAGATPKPEAPAGP
jgi:serine/threonine protein kinase/tetratricopeptide (TPR) repeat protein